MAVKIIDTKPHKDVVSEIICRSCGVTLEYVPIDVKSRIETDYTGGCDIIRFIECASCGNEVYVN